MSKDVKNHSRGFDGMSSPKIGRFFIWIKICANSRPNTSTIFNFHVEITPVFHKLIILNNFKTFLAPLFTIFSVKTKVT